MLEGGSLSPLTLATVCSDGLANDCIKGRGPGTKLASWLFLLAFWTHASDRLTITYPLDVRCTMVPARRGGSVGVPTRRGAIGDILRMHDELTIGRGWRQWI
jgi:hypothetical protein